MKRLAVLLGFVLFLLLPTSVAAAECQFVLGFATLRDLIGHEIIGECLENEHHNEIGDSVQQITGGLLVWRKADNWTAFTDGYRTWINGPNGLVQRLNTERFEWEADYAPGGGIATPTPVPAPTPAPVSALFPAPPANVELEIASLPNNPLEPKLASNLRRLARASQPVFWAYMRPRGSPISYIMADYIIDITQVDAPTALQIAQMPFLKTREPIVYDLWLLYEIRVLAIADIEGLRRVIAHPSLRGGITEDNIQHVPLLLMEQQYPELAAAIRNLPWVRDGIKTRTAVNDYSNSEDLELAQVIRLNWQARSRPQYLLEKLKKPWYQDGISAFESSTIRTLDEISRIHYSASIELLRMPFLSTLEVDDQHIIEEFRFLARLDLDGFEQLMSHPEVRDGIRDGQRSTIELLSLNIRSPQAAPVIAALPWIQDGVDISESKAVTALQWLGVASEQTLLALAQKLWLQDGLSEYELLVIESLHSIANKHSGRRDEEAALIIAQMPFLDTVDAVSATAMVALKELHHRNDRSYLWQVLSHPTIGGEITSSNKLLVAALREIARSGRLAQLDFQLDRMGRLGEEGATFCTLAVPTPASIDRAKQAIADLPWVRDGIHDPDARSTSFDPRVLEWGSNWTLENIAESAPEVVMALVGKPWLQQGQLGIGSQVLLYLQSMAHRGSPLALELANMPFLDSLSHNEAAITEALRDLVQREGPLESCLLVVSHPTLGQGITDDHRGYVELLVLSQDPMKAVAIETLPWVQDGLDPAENDAITTLYLVAEAGAQKLVRALARKHWVQDGLNSHEKSAIWMLLSITRHATRGDEGAALAILAMPFLEDVEGPIDAAVVRSLALLHSNHPERSYLWQVLSHPTLSGGINFANKSLVAILETVIPQRPELLDALLDPEQTSVEGRVVWLPRAGEVRLAVIHTRPGTFRTMDILEHVVRVQEEFMLEAFPTKFLGLLVADATYARGGGGLGIVTVDPGHEEDIGLIAHEVAHSYWRAHPKWIGEGGAELLTAIVENKPPSQESVQGYDLCIIRNLLELEKIDLEGSAGNCTYAMGVGFFADLYHGLGDGLFRQGFRNLYVKLRDEEHANSCIGDDKSICYMRAAFVTDATPQAAATAESIINRWFYGSGQESQ